MICRAMKVHLKMVLINKINKNTINKKISIDREIKKNKKKYIYMENQEMFQRNYTSI